MEDRQRQRSFLVQRPRRLRLNDSVRRMVRDITLTHDDFIAPLFVTTGRGVKLEISSMPGQFQFSVDTLLTEVESLVELGIRAVILFGIPGKKDSAGSNAFDPNGVVQQAVRSIKQRLPAMIVIADTCLCGYTDHGQCGALQTGGQDETLLPQDYLVNDATLDMLNRVAVSQAQAGADIVAPSGMIDGMVGSIRGALDDHQLCHVGIMSYSVKYASAYYGPFRDAADSAPKRGDRRSHQMDPAESKQPLLEAQLDVDQGADFLMVKPALAYLDVVALLRRQFPQHPLVAYNVSGEYSMIKAASMNGWLDEQAVVLESVTGIKRAGADLIITYFAKDICLWLEQ